GLSAQNLDPTVEVTREYVAGKVEVDKPAIRMAVPDTVLKFDMDFDYSVNLSPFRGSYKFTPYAVDVRPEPSLDFGKTFFLRAGAGYPLHPEIDLVVTPRFGKAPFTMSVYGTNRSYVGNYRPADLTPFKDGVSGEDYKGYCSLTKAGVNGRVDWRSGFFSFDFGYFGNAGKDTVRTRGFDAFTADVRVASNRRDNRYFFYDINMKYLLGRDKITSQDGVRRLVENDFTLKASLGPVLSEYSSVIVDLGLDVSDYAQAFSSYTANVSVTPKYVLTKNRWRLGLGVKLSFLAGGDWGSDAARMHANKGQYVYPAIDAGFMAVKDHLDIYFISDGGENINRYSDQLRRNPYYSILYGGTPLLDNSVERVNAAFGLRGNIASKFTFDVRGGYACHNNLLLDSAMPGVDGSAMPAIGYSDCNTWYLKADLGWRSQDLKADISLDYRSTDILKKARNVFAPEEFTAGADIVYNWRRRVYAGVHCTASLGCSGWFDNPYMPESPLLIKVPGYADLGVSLEYRFNRVFSFWVYGGNLLNMKVMRTPFVCGSGIWFNAGITLSL
ncbi:MAG: hypothetical protein ACI395_10895, partial [Candidatus Cryptobacteroides sp.]